MQGAKGIHPARVDPAVEFGPLLGEEPAVRDIRLRARQVDHAVRRVVVADHEHRAPAPWAPTSSLAAFDRSLSPSPCPTV